MPLLNESTNDNIDKVTLASTLKPQAQEKQKGSKINAQQRAIVKPVNGQIRECRGLRLLLLRVGEGVRPVTDGHLPNPLR